MPRIKNADSRLSAELEAARQRIRDLESTLSAQKANVQTPVSRDKGHSADYLRNLVSSIPDLVWLKDPDGVYLACNSAFESFFGAKESEIVGRRDHDFVSKELADFFREHDRKAMAAGKPSTNEEWLTFAANGRSGLFETIKTPMRDSDGNLIGVLGIARDITDRKIANEALEKRVVELTRPLDDAEGITFEDLFNIKDIQRLQDEFAEATGVASIITRPDGVPITAPSNFCRLCKDIIRKSETGRNNCFKSDAILGRLSTMGPKIQPCMSGGLWDAGAGISIGGRHIANWLIGQVRDETQTEAKIRSYAREIDADENDMVEAFLEVPAMSRERFGKVAKALYTLANQLSNIAYQNLQQARFIFERKQAEAHLIEVKEKAEAASKVKSEFLANMSHEIRTPLNGALSMLQLLETTVLSREQSEYLDAATTSAKRLMRLLSDILDISRIEAGKIQIEKKNFFIRDLEESILDLFSQTAKDRGNTLEFKLPDDIPSILVGDEARLRQIIFNLVGNALKFTENGRVTVEVSLLPRHKGPTRVFLFTVSDTGIGITDEQVKDIFEPFFQAEGSYSRKFQGAGLGLSIVRKLVRLMDGELAIDNGQEAGTTFYLSLPFECMRIDSKAHTQPAKAKPRVSPSPLRILLVEDETISRLGAKRLLEKEGHFVVAASNGEEALKCLEEARFDVIFMDIQMPIMDGVEATRRIRNSGNHNIDPDIPIVALTAYTMTGDRGKFLRAGMNDYIPKPIEADALSSVLARLFGNAAQR